MTLIKICGVQDVEFAVAAAEAGANYLGLIFVKTSRRMVDPMQAKIIMNAVKQYPITCVGVFMNQFSDEIEEICEITRIRHVQLYGERLLLSPELNKLFVVSVNDQGILLDDIKLINKECRPNRDAIVLDYENPGLGRTYPIETLTEQTKEIPFILAGGITIENVQQRLTQSGAIGVDAASAVHSIDRCREFISTVRNYQHANK